MQVHFAFSVLILAASAVAQVTFPPPPSAPSPPPSTNSPPGANANIQGLGANPGDTKTTLTIPNADPKVSDKPQLIEDFLGTPKLINATLSSTRTADHPVGTEDEFSPTETTPTSSGPASKDTKGAKGSGIPTKSGAESVLNAATGVSALAIIAAAGLMLLY